MMSFIRFGKFIPIIPSNIVYALQNSPIVSLMDLKLTISKTKLLFFSPPNLLFSKSPQLSKKHHIHPFAEDKSLREILNSSLSFTPPKYSVRLWKCFLSSPTLSLSCPPSPASTPHVSDADSLYRGLLTGLSAVYSPRRTRVIFSKQESGHMLLSLPDNLQCLTTLLSFL